ncbi:isochorismatase family protein [Ectobacillus ponti]|uniref:Isochorismatase family protein n=1 Tax=Ectobacillus ponti TaxID=2961894 RepID=A0AA41X701_9BACI|nr:isochorismatase family protein [Ectobacillus ponti]MCP8970094.1 isochorismatase family protein [Ectobacillus ponti]
MKQDVFEGFGSAVGPGVRPAIIVVDFIHGFTDPDCLLGSNMDKEIAATKELLDIAREKGILIVFTTVVYETHYKDGGHFIKKIPALKALTAESEWVKVDKRLTRNADTEPLVIKKYASSFFGTSLSSMLTAEKIDTVILAGCTTSGCVRATAVDALQHGYRVIIPEECVGDRSSQAHQANLYDIQTKYGDVVTLETVKTYLKGEFVHV